MTQHTPEPWGELLRSARALSHRLHAGLVVDEEASDLYQAVNACAGMADPAAELANLRAVAKAADKAERALRAVLAGRLSVEPVPTIQSALRAALAKLEGGAS